MCTIDKVRPYYSCKHRCTDLPKPSVEISYYSGKMDGYLHCTSAHEACADVTFLPSVQMLIKGIRSFNPDNQHVIEFYKPLTLIVGQNGAGKTVCLPYKYPS